VGRKRGWRFVLLVLLVAAVGGGWLLLAPEPDQPLSRNNYRRIRAGMTRAEVAEVLGGPPGAVGPVPKDLWFAELVEQEGPVDANGMPEGKPAIWYNDRGQIAVYFDTWEESGRVLGKQLYRRTNHR
jgi:hypothetical protein